MKKTFDFFGEKGILLFDAAMGTALLAAGQPPSTGSEEMNLISPDTVLRIHKENIKAGSDVITSNTFGVTQMMMCGKKEKALETLSEGMRLARTAVSEASANVLACLDIGPTGALLGPIGDVGYEAVEELYEAQAEAGALCGADFILLETFADLEEFARAARASIRASGLPVFGTMTFGASGRTFMGVRAADFVREARDSGLGAIGANCTLDPAGMVPVIGEIIAESGSGLPVIVQPNAGQPVFKDGKNIYEITTEEFAAGAEKLLDLGISAIGGCCGTTPEMISTIRDMIESRRVLK